MAFWASLDTATVSRHRRLGSKLFVSRPCGSTGSGLSAEVCIYLEQSADGGLPQAHTAGLLALGALWLTVDTVAHCAEVGDGHLQLDDPSLGLGLAAGPALQAGGWRWARSGWGSHQARVPVDREGLGLGLGADGPHADHLPQIQLQLCLAPAGKVYGS